MFLQRMTTKTGLEHNVYLPLREGTGAMSTFIVNQTRKEYLCLGNLNDKNAIDSVHLFMTTYGLWDSSDRTDSMDAKSASVPRAELGYHDISRMLIFYRMAVKRASRRQETISNHSGNRDENRQEQEASSRKATQTSPPIVTKHPKSLTTDEQMSGDSDSEKPVRRIKKSAINKKKTYEDISSESPEELPSVSDMSDLSSGSDYDETSSSEGEGEWQKEESTPAIKVPNKSSKSGRDDTPLRRRAPPSPQEEPEMSDLDQALAPRGKSKNAQSNRKSKKADSEEDQPPPRKSAKKPAKADSESEDEPVLKKKTVKKSVKKPVKAVSESEEEPVPKRKRTKKIATPEEESEVEESASEADESEAEESSSAEESSASEESSAAEGSDTDPSESDVSVDDDDDDDEPPSPVAPTKTRGRGGRGRGRGGAAKYSVELLNKKGTPAKKSTRGGRRGGKK